MLILAHTAPVHTATTSPPPEQGSGAFHIDLSNLTTSGGGLVVLAVLAWAAFKLFRGPRNETSALVRAMRGGRVGGFFGAVAGFFRALYRTVRALVLAVRAVLRFYGGYEMRGERRSNATFLRAGAPTTQAAPADAVPLGSIALAPRKWSLVKEPVRQPSPWARNSADWLASYRGKGARALDWTVRAALWCARAVRSIYRGLRTAYGVVAPLVATLVRVLRAWHSWPYAARGLLRIIATALLVVWFIPAGSTWAVLVALAAAVLFGLLLPQLVPQKPGDDAVYGPRIWAVLRDDLDLPEDEPRENWLLLPPSLAAEDARIVIRLPWTWRGSESDRENLSALVNSRLPGQWVARVTLTGETFTAVYTHKPAPKPPAPDPEPPTAVDIWDPKVQEILAALGPDEFYLGQDTFDQPVIQKMSDEQAHWALSVGSGGGKSAFLQWLAIQMLMKRGTVVVIDGKMVSMTPLIGIQGTHSYVNPQAPQDMRATLMWVAEVVNARNYEKKHKTRTDFPPLYVILEECNHLADILKEEYTANKESGAPAGDPIWRDGVAAALRLGREVNVHIIAVFQDFKDTQFGGVSLVPLFPFKILGSYSERQWKRIMGASFPMPTIQKKAGRMVLALDSGDVTRIQTPYVPWDPEITKDENQQRAYKLLTAYYEELRATYGYETTGLYAAPPAHSPEVAPALLRRLSRDTGPEGPNGGSEGGLSDETAGRGVTLGGSVTPGVTPQRDRLRLVPGQAGPGAPEGSVEAPTLLTIAEIAREMQGRGYDIEAGLIRQHKRRKESTGFPEGITTADGEKFTLGQLITFYEQRGIEKREESEVEAEQDDAV